MHLHDLGNLLPHDLAHRVSRWLGLEDALTYFCLDCPEPTLWDAVEEDSARVAS